jgi:hypothetical protein
MKVALTSVALLSREIRNTRVLGDFSTRWRNSAMWSGCTGGRSSISGRMSTPSGVAST